jgi:formate dehydrogenase subunit gamma
MDREGRSPRRSPETFVRFSPSQRMEHLLIMISFTALVVTGLPQKFFGAGWAQNLILLMGGIDNTRFLHRAFAILFCLEAVYHFGYIIWLAAAGRFVPTMIPTRKDLRDALQSFSYAAGFSPRRPVYGRFDFRQKFEYWGVLLGGIIVIVTGLILWFPVEITRFLPGAIVPAAREMHGGEALLALSIIVTWHLYGAHLNPKHFPGDKTIFTGRISREKMIEDHPLEYARLTGTPVEEVIAQLEEHHQPDHPDHPPAG